MVWSCKKSWSHIRVRQLRIGMNIYAVEVSIKKRGPTPGSPAWSTSAKNRSAHTTGSENHQELSPGETESCWKLRWPLKRLEHRFTCKYFSWAPGKGHQLESTGDIWSTTELSDFKAKSGGTALWGARGPTGAIVSLLSSTPTQTAGRGRHQIWVTINLASNISHYPGEPKTHNVHSGLSLFQQLSLKSDQPPSML